MASNDDDVIAQLEELFGDDDAAVANHIKDRALDDHEPAWRHERTLRYRPLLALVGVALCAMLPWTIAAAWRHVVASGDAITAISSPEPTSGPSGAPEAVPGPFSPSGPSGAVAGAQGAAEGAEVGPGHKVYRGVHVMSSYDRLDRMIEAAPDADLCRLAVYGSVYRGHHARAALTARGIDWRDCQRTGFTG